MLSLSRTLNARLRQKSPIPPTRSLPPTPPEDDSDSDDEMSDHLPYLLDDNFEEPFHLLPSHPLDLICQFHNVKRVSLEEGVPPPAKLDVPIRRNSSSSSTILPTHVLAVYEPERPSTQSSSLGQSTPRATTPVMIPVNADIWNKYVDSALPAVQEASPLLSTLSKWRNKRHSRRDSMDSLQSKRSSSCASDRSSSSLRSRPTTVLSLPVHSICIPSARTLPLLLLVLLRIVPENRVLPALLPQSVLYEMPAPVCMLTDKLMAVLYPDGLPKLEKKASRERMGRDRQNTIRAQRSVPSLSGRHRQDTIRSRSVLPPVTGRLRGDTVRARTPLPPPQTSLPPPPSPTTHLTVPVIPLHSSPHPNTSPPVSPTRSSTPNTLSSSPNARSLSRSSSRSSLAPSPTTSTPYHHQRYFLSSPKLLRPPLPEPICTLADPTLASSPDRRLLALAQQNLGLWVNALALGVREPTLTSNLLHAQSSQPLSSPSALTSSHSKSVRSDKANPVRCIELAWAVVAEARVRRFGDSIAMRDALTSKGIVGMGMGVLGTGFGNKLVEVDEVKRRTSEWDEKLASPTSDFHGEEQ